MNPVNPVKPVTLHMHKPEDTYPPPSSQEGKQTPASMEPPAGRNDADRAKVESSPGSSGADVPLEIFPPWEQGADLQAERTVSL